MKIGDRIKQIRLSKNISQKQLASILNIPVSTLANYENNHREPKIETLKKIANALSVPLTDLMNDSLHHFAIASAYEHNRAMSDINNNLTNSFNTKKELTQITISLGRENIKYIEKLSEFYELLEQLKQTDIDIETIENKITKIGLENFKDILEELNLDIILKSLYLSDTITNFLEEPKDKEIQRQLQIILDDFNVPKGKKLKLTLVDSE